MDQPAMTSVEIDHTKAQILCKKSGFSECVNDLKDHILRHLLNLDLAASTNLIHTSRRTVNRFAFC